MSDRLDDNLRASLLGEPVDPLLSEHEISEQIQTLEADRDAHQCDITSIDLRVGQLVEALYATYVKKFGKRKRRGSNAPTQSEYLEKHGGNSASWLRRCYKAFTIVAYDPRWTNEIAPEWDWTGGIERLIKLAKKPGKPRQPRRDRKLNLVLDDFATAAAHKDWQEVQRAIDYWDGKVTESE